MQRDLALEAGEALDDFERDGGTYSVAAYLEHFALVADELEQLARKQLAGEPYTSEDLEFINGMVATRSVGEK